MLNLCTTNYCRVQDYSLQGVPLKMSPLDDQCSSYKSYLLEMLLPTKVARNNKNSRDTVALLVF